MNCKIYQHIKPPSYDQLSSSVNVNFYSAEAPNPCEPSPCGQNSICRIIKGSPTCSCQVGFFGTPPRCRPECAVSSECSFDRACINQKCQDPCPGACKPQTRCQIVNHNPVCIKGNEKIPFVIISIYYCCIILHRSRWR